MGFFSRLEKIDGGINGFYARWRKWIWGALLLPVVIYLGWSVWAAVWGPPSGPVTLIIHNELDRPILGFSVNGVAGANAFAHGGGKATCCGSISGDRAEVIWTLDITHEQYLKGMRLESRRIEIPMPVRKQGENDLHVHFLPGDKVLLGWSDNAWSPYEKRPEQTQSNKMESN
ncbi:DUF3304 domain-containing protein [Enterobacter roggenkampii]|jgi:hypothetical protein|uniref:DUF3304 domain-containing protein n=1 Tax=Enterobacter TaxID=547 RepID=UPI0006DA1C72|nr:MULTISPECIES: DUF3304 domain-containing protein [Enterobacter]AYY06042.1 DUF3304 domain-containing protein [Enterobacter roggenkampii]MBA7913639.1 DUF3304 domain-containing protein [Enterobacter roggenkampii]MCU4025818.1 DUF3304 domain-containing protein [Enterobacter roggenkampii]MDU6060018.1 DUF3304 domain-containing protein [Enterobacter sp.]MEB6118068.1 DUF3304 domain-containing protein [Enterobacter roggenkampii]